MTAPDPSPSEDFRSTAGRFGEVVAGTRPDQWDGPSPVAEWTARDVVRHLVEWLPPFLEGGAGITISAGPSVDEDPAGAWRHFQDQVQELLDDPATQERVLSNPHIGDVPVPQAVAQFFTADVFQHTWDLARATGQDDTLDPERCAAMVDGMEGMPGLEEMMRGSGQFGPRVAVPEGADPQTRLIGFIGRDPQWRPPAA